MIFYKFAFTQWFLETLSSRMALINLSSAVCDLPHCSYFNKLILKLMSASLLKLSHARDVKNITSIICIKFTYIQL